MYLVRNFCLSWSACMAKWRACQFMVWNWVLVHFYFSLMQFPMIDLLLSFLIVHGTIVAVPGGDISWVVVPQMRSVVVVFHWVWACWLPASLLVSTLSFGHSGSVV